MKQNYVVSCWYDDWISSPTSYARAVLIARGVHLGKVKFYYKIF
jgi:hypothetical protein